MITIGVDESGTGAWAGSFTVCALAGYMRDSDYLRSAGVDDSKKLSDRRRRQLCGDIVGYALAGHIEEVTAQQYNTLGARGSLRAGVRHALTAVFDTLIEYGMGPQLAVVVDGNEDPNLVSWLRRSQRELGLNLWVRFIPKADSKFPFVAGASILAKTHRNDLMLQLHETYPEYGWAQNAGYGTPEHQEALAAHGKTRFHRDMKPMAGIPDRVD